MTEGPRTAALLDRVARATEAVELSGDRLPPQAVVAAMGALDRARDRLALGADHTVVALAGGTGSGKSSLFNAIAGLPFAEVGVQRPTTSQVTACVWAHDATALLDWLQVDPLRRRQRESALDADTQAALRGLVLLDLPDHDSIAPEHRDVVDRILPQADLIVWVVDPQKYADQALHGGYLRHLGGHSAAMIVVVNQVDTVPPGARAALLADVARLLEADGLTGVGVYPVSAANGEGLEDLHQVLEAAVAGHGLAEVRAGVAVEEAVLAVAARTGTTPALPVRDAIVAGLVEAAGVPGQAAALETPGSAGLAAFTGLGPVQVARAETERRAWLLRATADLPGPWRDALARAVPDGAALAAAIDDRLTTVRPRTDRGRAPVVATAAWATALLGTLAGLGATVGSGLAEGTLGGTGTVLAVATGIAALATVVLLGVARAARRRFALRRAGEVTEAAGAAVAAVVAEQVEAPAAAVLAEHAAVVELLERARAARSTPKPADTSSPS